MRARAGTGKSGRENNCSRLARQRGRVPSSECFLDFAGCSHKTTRLLVERLGVGGGGRDVGVTGSLVGAGGELELVGGLQVGITGRAVGGGVILEVEKEGEHGGFCVRGSWEGGV